MAAATNAVPPFIGGVALVLGGVAGEAAQTFGGEKVDAGLALVNGIMVVAL